MKGFPVRPVPVESVGEAAKAVARRQAEQLTLVRRRAQPTAVYIARLTLTAVFAYLLALQLPGGSTRSVLAPLTALLVVQATLFHTIRSAVLKVVAVTAGVLAAVAVSAYVPFSWWVLGLLIAGTLVLGLILRLREEILEVPISAMLIFSYDSHAAATSRITETLVGAAAGLAAGLVFAPLRVEPAKEAVGDLSRQMADLLAQMADGLAEAPPDPKRAAEWLDRTRALRGEIERVDDALATAEESVRLNPRRLRWPDPAAGLREGVDTLERAATDMRVLARSVADSARIDSEHSPVKEAETRARLAAVIAELSAAVRAYGQLLEADPVAPAFASFAAEPIAEVLEDHLEEAQRQQDQLADLLSTDPAERPEGWQLRGEILAHVDRLRSELEPGHLPEPVAAKPPLLALRERGWGERARGERHRGERREARRGEARRGEERRGGERRDGEGYRESATGPRRRPNRAALRVRARRTASRVRSRRASLEVGDADGETHAGCGRLRLAVVDGFDVVAVRVAQEDAVVPGVVLRELARGVQHFHPGGHRRLVHGVHRAAVGRPEGDVQFPGLGSGGRAEPEDGRAFGAGQADHDAVAVGEAHRLAHPDREPEPDFSHVSNSSTASTAGPARRALRARCERHETALRCRPDAMECQFQAVRQKATWGTRETRGTRGCCVTSPWGRTWSGWASWPSRRPARGARPRSITSCSGPGAGEPARRELSGERRVAAGLT